MGLSATAHSGGDYRAGCSPPPSTSHRTDEIAIVADFIRCEAGPQAHRISQDLLAAQGSLANLLHPLQMATGWKSLPLSEAVRARLRLLAKLFAPPGVVIAGPVVASSDMLRRYFHTEMAQLSREAFRVLFLDAGNHLLSDRIMWEGTVNKVQVHPREIVRVAIETGATALILAHNHPSGRPSPSNEDQRVTRQIVDACIPMDICVHDHLIITRGGICSMAACFPQLFSRRAPPTMYGDRSGR